MHRGYIKIWRKIMDTSFYRKPLTCRLAEHLLLICNHKPQKVIFEKQEIVINRGQCVTGRRTLSKETGISEQSIRTALQILSNCGFLTIKSTSKFSIISIINYNDYQDKSNPQVTHPFNDDFVDKFDDSSKINPQTNPQNTQCKINETNPPINQQLTSKQPASNPQTNHKQECINNDKNDKNIIPPISPLKSGDDVNNQKQDTPKPIKRFIKPSVNEIRSYCQERNNGIDAEQFWNFYESKGWVVGKSPMKDWRAAVRTWERGRNQIPKYSQTNNPDLPNRYYDEGDMQRIREALKEGGNNGNDDR